MNRVVADEKLQDEAWARQLAAGPTAAYGLMKTNLDRAPREELDACLAHEAEGIVQSAGSDDHREAVRAFLEKRPPIFKGR